MRKWQGYSILALVCGTVGVACGTSGDSGTQSTASATSALSAPQSNTANLDAVMNSAVTQNYLTAAGKNDKCAADANKVMQIVQTLEAALGDPNATLGNGNVTIAADANSAAVISVFETDLPELESALAALQQCVQQNRCGGGSANMGGNIPSFPCGKPGSSTFPHPGNGNTTGDANTMCGGDDSHHHPTPVNPNVHGTTTGSVTTGGTTTAGTTTAGSTTAGTTAGHTTGGATTAGTTTVGMTTAGSTTAGTTTAGTTTAGSTTAGTTTAGSTTAGTTTAGTTTAGTTTAGTTTAGGTTGAAPVNPSGNIVTNSNCIGVVLGGRSFVGCGVEGL